MHHIGGFTNRPTSSSTVELFWTRKNTLPSTSWSNWKCVLCISNTPRRRGQSIFWFFKTNQQLRTSFVCLFVKSPMWCTVAHHIYYLIVVQKRVNMGATTVCTSIIRIGWTWPEFCFSLIWPWRSWTQLCILEMLKMCTMHLKYSSKSMGYTYLKMRARC